MLPVAHIANFCYDIAHILQTGETRLKRLICLFAALLLWIGPARAEEPAPMPTPLYVGRVTQNLSVRAEKSREVDAVGYLREGERARIIAYDPGWLTVVCGTEGDWYTGYVLRHTVHDIMSVAEGVPPYGAEPAAYTATLGKDAPLYAQPAAEGEPIMTMEAGTRLALLDIEDGWGCMIYHRQYAYVYLDAVEALTPVYDTASARPGDTIAAYVSFFNLSERGLNPNRIVNIGVACEYICMELVPGQDFSFNGIAGPYRKTRGYFEAPAFVGGETVASYGGGTCQVSSTLYNALLPLTSESLTIVYRVAHGAGGASYLPHGVDAACGNEKIDLKFRNDYPFAIRIEASAQYGVLYIGIVRD